MVYKIEFEPIGKRTVLLEETNILEAAWKAGINIESVCGGKGICKKCKVKVLEGDVSPVTEQEKRYLSNEEHKAKYRFACCTKILGDMKIYIPRTSLSQAQRFGLLGKERKIRLDSPIKKRLVCVDEPSFNDVRSDISRVIDGHKKKYNGKNLFADLTAIRKLSSMLREGQWKITVATYANNEIISVAPWDTTSRCFGIAVDLGTTKVAVYLVDLLSGKTIDSLGAMNPQISYGEDVIARATAILSAPDNDIKLQRVITDLLNHMILELSARNKINNSEILDMVVVGNTAMHHILMRLPVRQLALAPYVPAASDSLNVKARELGIEIAGGGYVYIPPVIAGFVGPDHVAMLLASDIDKLGTNVIAIDIGTNTEISLIANGKKALTCSCASGPALEGRHIQFGMRAASGAIEHVKIDQVSGEVLVRTIDGKPAVGICGSGILDVTAELFRAGIINEKGHLIPGMKGVRWSEDNKGREFLLVPKEETGLKEDIVITQDDISAVQLAKGAIRAGIDILLEYTGISPAEITNVVIAGAFGNFIDPSNALFIGMFPDFPLEIFVQVGNAAGVGAKMMLLSRRLRKKAVNLARNNVDYLELMTYPSFSRKFADALKFPLKKRNMQNMYSRFWNEELKQNGIAYEVRKS
jgi:uncharacterized 2Fe-2S/4Fe-4S cluster protein (DUF4445 family)